MFITTEHDQLRSTVLRFVEAEINPLFVLADGQGVAAADGVVLLGD